MKKPVEVHRDDGLAYKGRLAASIITEYYYYSNKLFTKTYHNAYASLNDPRNSVCNCNSYFFALLRPVQNEGDDIFLVLNGGKERCW